MNLTESSVFQIVEVGRDKVMHLALANSWTTLCGRPVARRCPYLPPDAFVPGNGDPDFKYCERCAKRRDLKGGVGS